MQPVSGPRRSASAAPSASIHFEIPREKKNPPDDRSHSSMRACIQRSFHESLYLFAPAAPADVTSVWGAAPAILRSAGSGFVCHWHAARGWVHVFLHGAASAHPQSPRIGRTLLSSLGELTGGAGLRRHERCARFSHRLGIQGQIVGVGWCWVASLCILCIHPAPMKSSGCSLAALVSVSLWLCFCRVMDLWMFSYLIVYNLHTVYICDHMICAVCLTWEANLLCRRNL